MNNCARGSPQSQEQRIPGAMLNYGQPDRHRRQLPDPEDTEIHRALKIIINVYRFGYLAYDLGVFIIKFCLEVFRAIFGNLFPPKEREIAGQTALITGAGHGLGRQLALDLAELGVTVVCVDIHSRRNRRTVEIVEGKGQKAFGYTCDVSKPDQVMSLQERVHADVGDVHLLFNIAGILYAHKFTSATMETLKNIVDVNLTGQMLILRAFLPQMLAIEEPEQASIVSIAAFAAHAGTARMTAFSASKFGVRGMMESLKIEIRQEYRKKRNLHLMTVNPWIMDSGQVFRPRIRLPGFFRVVPTNVASETIIREMRRRTAVLFLPGGLYYLINFVRLLPLRSQLLLTDVCDTGVYEHAPGVPYLPYDSPSDESEEEEPQPEPEVAGQVGGQVAGQQQE